MGKNLLCNAKEAGLIPGQGTKIPHAGEHLSPRATTRETVRCDERSCTTQRSSCVLQPRSNLATSVHSKNSFLSSLCICCPAQQQTEFVPLPLESGGLETCSIEVKVTSYHFGAWDLRALATFSFNALGSRYQV